MSGDGGQGGHTDSVQRQFGRPWSHFITLVRMHNGAAVCSQRSQACSDWEARSWFDLRVTADFSGFAVGVSQGRRSDTLRLDAPSIWR